MPRGVYDRSKLSPKVRETQLANLQKGRDRVRTTHTNETRQKIAESLSTSIAKKWQNPEYREKQMQTKRLKGREFWQEHMKHASGFHRFASTEIERLIGHVLQVLNVEYVEQYQIGRYRCDIFVPSKNLVIECDGEYWHSFDDAVERDRRKDEFLGSKGFTIRRFKEADIWDHPFELVEEVLR